MFSPNFRITSQITNAHMQIESCRQAINDLPINAVMLQHLRETAALATTHFSTQIEGNRLTLPEVRAALKGEKFPGRERDEMEVRNHFRALEEMEALATGQGPITEENIKRLHGLVLYGHNKPTPYRAQQNVIREAGSGAMVYLPPEAHGLAVLMQGFVTWIKDELEKAELPVPIIAGFAHYQFATIHPYLDGNGRTARLLTTLILRKTGYGLKGIYSLDEHYAKNLKAYYAALTVGTHNYYDGRAEADITNFVSYFCAGMADAFSKIKLVASQSSKETHQDQSATLRDLDPRQRRLLELFQKNGSATAEEMAAHLKMSQRTLVQLCREWVASGFLEYQNSARKNRSYRLCERYHRLTE